MTETPGQEGGRPRYFEEALSDFTHDVASGRAIRHLADLGYTTEQIMARLDYPTQRSRVEQTIYRHLKERGVIREDVPELREVWAEQALTARTPAEILHLLGHYLDVNGEKNAYISCPFGTIYRDREARLQRLLAPLTMREREYILGIPWERKVVYHCLNGRMLEIGAQLALSAETEFRFYFLKSGVMLGNRSPKEKKAGAQM